MKKLIGIAAALVGLGVLCIAGLIVVGLIVGGGSSPSSSTAAVSGEPAKPAWDKSDKAQAVRKDAIQKAIELEVFSKVVQDGDLAPRAWTGKTFNSVDFDTKKNALGIVYAYFYDGTKPYQSIAIIDGRNGKEIGRFSMAGGLDLD